MNKHTHSTEVRHDSVIVPHFCPGHQKFKKKKEDRKEEDMKTENEKDKNGTMNLFVTDNPLS